MAQPAVMNKCRLCLKLGDFRSIFAEDNSTRLSKMAMACSDIRVHEGDGLPDKVCGECVEKLNAAYLFKQQCERSDAELRKTLDVPPDKEESPKIDKAPVQPERISKVLPQRNVKNKRKHNETEGVDDNAPSEENRGVDSENVKKRRLSESPAKELYDCKYCPRKFTSMKGLYGHSRVHNNEIAETKDMLLRSHSQKPDDINDDDKNANDSAAKNEKFDCERCGENFPNGSSHDEHSERCKNSQMDEKYILRCFSRLTCPVCGGKYKKKYYLRRHIARSSCGIKLKKSTENTDAQQLLKYDNALSQDREDSPKRDKQCSNCKAKFWSHSSMLKHFLKCIREIGIVRIRCMTCNMNFSNKNCLYKHVRRVHILKEAAILNKKTNNNMLECNKCFKSFDDQNQLVIHLAAHLANNETEHSGRKTFSQIYKCGKCFKKFRYRAFLIKHIKKFHGNLPVDMCEIIDPPNNNQCDLCGKNFKHPKSLIWHKNTTHPMIDDSLIQNKQAIEFSACGAKCLHCDIIFDSEPEIKAHNKIHIENNMKVRNEYTCPECSLKFTNIKIFRLHFKEHNVSNYDDDNYDDGENELYDASISNFCEVTSSVNRDSDTEIEIKPLVEFFEDAQPHPIIESDGVVCSLCNKKLDSIRSYHLHTRIHKRKIEKSGPYLTCFICQERFTDKNAHQEHLEMHHKDNITDPALLTCSICKRVSKDMRSYIAHLTWHTENGPFKCHLCEENFPYHKQYKNHMLVKHNINVDEILKETDYRCNVCVKYLENEDSLQYHLLCHQKDSTTTKEDIFECFDCNEQFENQYQYMAHVQSCHHNYPAWECHDFIQPVLNYNATSITAVDKNANKITCPICELIFPSRMQLNKHLMTTHPLKKIVKNNDPDAGSTVKHVCVLCNKEFSTDERLQAHLTLHNRRPKPFKCTLCGKRSLSFKYHLYHLKSHLFKSQKGSPLKCDKCTQEFIRLHELRTHLMQAHNVVENYVVKIDEEQESDVVDEEFQCYVCDKKLPSLSAYNNHTLWHNSRKCNYCFSYFDTKFSLMAHIKNNCSKKKQAGNSDCFDKTLKCQKCDKHFSIAVKLHCHMMVQHNVQPATRDVSKSSVCDYCFSVFPSEERVLSHRRVHFYTASMKCKICSKSFRVLSYFKSHKKRHYKQSYADDPLKCDHCDEKFTTINSFIDHLKVAHQKEMVWLVPDEVPSEKCNICSKEFIHLERHMMYHEKYKCKKCNQYFFSEDLYENHYCEVEDGVKDVKVASIKTETVSDEIPAKKEAEDYSECDYCFKPITAFYTREKHDSNHSKNVYFYCRLCDRKFFMKSAFNVHSTAHRLQHFNKNPLLCRHCGQSFTRYQHYTDHIKQAHDDPETMEFHMKSSEPKECLICKKDFVNLHRHYKYHLSFRCRNCSKYILSQKLYNSHNCNDESEDPNLAVEFDGDISSLVESDTNEWENERLTETIPRGEDKSRNPSRDEDTPKPSSSNSSENTTINNSSTVPLSSPSDKEKTKNDDLVNIKVKHEPIDHYYKEYDNYSLQNQLMNNNSPSG